MDFEITNIPYSDKRYRWKLWSDRDSVIAESIGYYHETACYKAVLQIKHRVPKADIYRSYEQRPVRH